MLQLSDQIDPTFLLSYGNQRADIHKRGFLDFSDFQVFVKYLRRRPEVEDLMRSLSGSSESVNPVAFKTFLRKTQMVRFYIFS